MGSFALDPCPLSCEPCCPHRLERLVEMGVHRHTSCICQLRIAFDKELPLSDLTFWKSFSFLFPFGKMLEINKTVQSYYKVKEFQ